MNNSSTAMVSRSLRLKKETLEVLKKQADLQGLGITVYIRKILESLVDNLNAADKLTEMAQEEGLYESRVI